MVKKSSSTCRVSPRRPCRRLSLSDVVGPKILTPLSDGLIGDGDASLGEKIFHLAKNEAEAAVEPDGMADDFGWKAVPVVYGWFGMGLLQISP